MHDNVEEAFTTLEAQDDKGRKALLLAGVMWEELWREAVERAETVEWGYSSESRSGPRTGAPFRRRHSRRALGHPLQTSASITLAERGGGGAAAALSARRRLDACILLTSEWRDQVKDY